MCLAYPMTLMEIDGAHGTVEARGLRLRVGLALVPEAKVGDALLVHAGYAIAIVDEAEAEATRRLFAELATFERSRDQGDEAPDSRDGDETPDSRDRHGAPDSRDGDEAPDSRDCHGAPDSRDGDEAPALHDGVASRGSSTHGTGRDD